MNRFSTFRAAALLLATSLSLSSAANAATWCSGKVAQIFTTRGGSVVILPYFSNDYVQICELNTHWKGVPPITCAYWNATITTGMLKGKDFTFYYDDATAVCSTMPAYSGAPSPYYIMVNE
jgi:hypothetical protein